MAKSTAATNLTARSVSGGRGSLGGSCLLILEEGVTSMQRRCNRRAVMSSGDNDSEGGASE